MNHLFVSIILKSQFKIEKKKIYFKKEIPL
jgi:hypothetical protein